MLARMWRKGNPGTLLVGMWIGAATMENSMEVPQKPKNRTTISSGSPTPGYISKETKPLIWKDTCTPVFIAALFTIAKVWKQPKCPSTDEVLNKMWCIYIYTHIHTQEYYSAKKKKMKFCSLPQHRWTWWVSWLVK